MHYAAQLKIEFVTHAALKFAAHENNTEIMLKKFNKGPYNAL